MVIYLQVHIRCCPTSSALASYQRAFSSFSVSHAKLKKLGMGLELRLLSSQLELLNYGTQTCMYD